MLIEIVRRTVHIALACCVLALALPAVGCSDVPSHADRPPLRSPEELEGRVRISGEDGLSTAERLQRMSSHTPPGELAVCKGLMTGMILLHDFCLLGEVFRIGEPAGADVPAPAAPAE